MLKMTVGCYFVVVLCASIQISTPGKTNEPKHHANYNRIANTNCNTGQDNLPFQSVSANNDVTECANECAKAPDCVAFTFHWAKDDMHCLLKSVCDEFVVDFNMDTYIKTASLTECTFEASPGYSLYGHNDKRIDYATLEDCKEECLSDGDHCLSFDYTTKSERMICYLSSESRTTASDSYGKNVKSTYYHKVCNTDIGKYD